jgi:ribosomal protein S6E (S10)
MKTLAITVTSKKQERMFATLAQELGVEITEAKFKPLTTKQVATGIGRAFTDNELEEYLLRTSGGKPKPAAKVKSDLKKRLAAK